MSDMENEPKFNKQFLTALNAASVSSKLGEIIKNAFAPNEKTIIEDVNKKFAQIMTTITLLRDELKQRDIIIADLKEANNKLTAENNGLKTRIVEVETATRRENLTFTGLKLAYADVAANGADHSTTSQRIVEQVVTLCNDVLDVPIVSDDISAAYPIHKGSTTSPPVVLVKFVRRNQRDKVYLARKKLRSLSLNSKIFINEDLLNDSRKLLGILRGHVKNHSLLGAWSNFGKIYAKKLDLAVVTVTKLSDLGF